MNQALATSGDYRQFFVENGVRYSHIIDPKTGYPVNNRVVSVSILAGDCTSGGRTGHSRHGDGR